MKLLAEKGFTLIELIVVIVIIGILAAIAVPKFQDLSNQAQQAACVQNMASVESACSIYFSNTALGGAGLYPSNIYSAAQLSNTTYFAGDGATPTCPSTAANYNYDGNGGVTCNTHAR